MSSRTLVVVSILLCLASVPAFAGPVDAPPLSAWQIVSAWWTETLSIFDAIGPQGEPFGQAHDGTDEMGPQMEPNGQAHNGTDEMGPQGEPFGQAHDGTDEIGPQGEPIGQAHDGTDEIGPQPEPNGNS